MNKFYWICLFITSGLLSSCQNNTQKENKHDHNTEKEIQHAYEPGTIILESTKAEAARVKTKKITKKSFTNIIRTSGKILAAQGSESTVIATVSGIVSFGNKQLAEGMTINRDETLLSIASKNLIEGDIVIKTKAAYEQASEEYKRMKDLVSSQIVSRQDYEKSKLNFENTQTAWKAIENKQTKHGVAINSPINGFLKNLQVKEGDFVNVGTPLATISQNRKLRLRAEVSEKYYSELASVRTANFKTPYDDRVYQLEELKGQLISTAKSVEENSFYLPVTFEFENRGTIIPGSFVEIFLLTEPKKEVISVPHSALIEEQGIFSIYTRLDENCYKKISVVCGMDNGSEVEILKGLEEGDIIVTDGAFQIKLASTSNAIPAHTHSH